MIDDYTKEQLKSGLTSYVQSITQPDRRAGPNMYKCPLCPSGNNGGRNSDGAFSVTRDGKSWKCFSCQKSGDIFTLIGLYEGLTEFRDQAARAAKFAGISLNLTEEQREDRKNFAEMSERKQPETGRYKDYIERCKAAAGSTDYFNSRGFSKEVVERFNLGYDADNGVIVIPYDRENSYYLTRSVEGKTFRKPRSDNAGQEPIYNKAALQSSLPCFVCESPIDAISIMTAGGGKCSAIALGGTGHRKLIEAVTACKPACTLVLSFDADEAGEKATQAAAKDLEGLKAPFIIANYSIDVYPNERRKDPNDFLRGNLEQFQKDITATIEEVERLENAEIIAALEEHNANSAKERLKDFKGGIKDSANTSYTPTGFSELDKILDGGLYPGLYILGAVSSIGKTTLLLQLADQIAQSGKDILYFSLEMAASELISKSISRLTYKLCKGYRNNAKTSRGITTASRYQNYSQTEKQLINDAMDAYSEYAGNIYFYEGIGDIGVEEIKRRTEEHVKLTGKTPLIFIDYIQILAPYEIRASDKQNTDKAVLELKRLSRDYKTTVFGISSFNRDNYNTEVNAAAFKESGALEYGSDVLLALQPQGMKKGYTKKEQKANAITVEACRKSKERNVELVILKNRNGQTGDKIGFMYYSLFNCLEQDYNFVPEKFEEMDDYSEDDLLPF